jgi:hypothetical protein
MPETAKTWTIKICPDCGNHTTSFVLCEHQKGGDGPTGIDFDKFQAVEVVAAEPVADLLERLRDAYHLTAVRSSYPPQANVVRDLEALLRVLRPEGQAG